MNKERIASRRLRGRRLLVEKCEERRLLATLTVTSTDDVGIDATLRNVIAAANIIPGVDTIRFDPQVFSTPQTIRLGNELPRITDSVEIIGPGANLLTIDAGHGLDGVKNTGDGWGILTINLGVFGVNLSGVTLTGGDDRSSGGAIQSFAGLLTVSDSVITHNASNDAGGGIDVEGALTLQRTEVSNNVAEEDGGGVRVRRSSSGLPATLTIESSTVAENESNGNAGGVALIGFRESLVLNSTISGNQSRRAGGGILAFGSDEFLNVEQSTITNNTGRTGGLLLSLAESRIRNTIIAGNHSTEVNDVGISFGASIDSQGYNIIGSDVFNESGDVIAPFNETGDRVGIDAGLRSLDNNGGPTRTHALQISSPAIDAGGASDGLEFDQRGAPFQRQFGSGVDIGAFEFSKDRPELLSFQRHAPLSEVTDADELVFRVTFGEEVLGVNEGDFVVTGAGEVTSVVPVSGQPEKFDVFVGGNDLVSFDGTVGLDLRDSHDITDLIGLSVPAQEPPIDETYTIDHPILAERFVVQKGASQRSFVNSVDIYFSSEVNAGQFLTDGRVSVERFDLNEDSAEEGTGTQIDWAFAFAIDNVMGLNFGADGIGGEGAAGNGFYRVSVDTNGDGQSDTSVEFFRLHGDANGDGTVDRTDSRIRADLDGNGRFDVRDRRVARSQLGGSVDASLLSLIDGS